MKTLKIIIFLLGLSALTFSQKVHYSLTGISNKKISSSTNEKFIDSDKKVIILDFDPKFGYLIKSENINLRISPSEIKKITFDNPDNNKILWQTIRIHSDMDANLVTKGYQYDLRKELEDETIALLQYLEENYGFFNDDYLKDYIQSLLYKVHPITLEDSRPGNLKIKILQSGSPNAFCTPTGTIIVTTGLLSTIRSEDELIGILAHEIAHFVLDHQVVNINKAIDRKKRAEFWAGLATAVAAASEVYLAEKHGYYPTGAITQTTAILSSSIASSVIDRVGANYSQEQEWEADNAAVLELTFLNKDPKALSAALSRIQNYCVLNGDFLSLTGSGTHPAMEARIIKIGQVDPNSFNSSKYDRTISLINSFNAINEYGLSHIETSLSLADRNIEAKVATEEDYVIKAMSIRLLYDTPEKNQEALELINKAKILNVTPNSYVFKQEGITLLRLGKSQEAVEAFKTYLKNLEIEKDNSAYFHDEIDWTKKMIYKSTVL